MKNQSMKALVMGLYVATFTFGAVAPSFAATLPPAPAAMPGMTAFPQGAAGQVAFSYSLKAQDSIGVYGIPTSFRAQISGLDNPAGKQVRFTVDGMPAGAATTDGQGMATLNYEIPAGISIGDHVLEAIMDSSGNLPRLQGRARFALMKQTTALSVSPYNMSQASLAAPRVVSASGRLSGYGSKTGLVGRSVSVYLDNTLLGKLATSATGHYEGNDLNIPNSFPAGSHKMRAVFEGDTHYIASEASWDTSVPALMKGDAYVAVAPTVSPPSVAVDQSFAVATLIHSGSRLGPPIANTMVRFVVESVATQSSSQNGPSPAYSQSQDVKTNAMGIATATFPATHAGGYGIRVVIPIESGYTDKTRFDFDLQSGIAIAKAASTLSATTSLSQVIPGQQIPVHVRLRSASGKPLQGSVTAGNANATTINGEGDIVITANADTFGEKSFPIQFKGNDDYLASHTSIKVQVVPSDK